MARATPRSAAEIEAIGRAGEIVGIDPVGVIATDKVEDVVDQDNPAMFWGRKLEPVVRDAYCEIVGREVVDGAVRHAVAALIVANQAMVVRQGGDRLFAARLQVEGAHRLRLGCAVGALAAGQPAAPRLRRAAGLRW